MRSRAGALAAAAVMVAVGGAMFIPVSAVAGTASTVSYQGQIAPSGSVAFDTKVRNGIVKRIVGRGGSSPTGLTFEQLPATCDEGASQLAVTIVSTLWVHDLRFHFVAKTTDPALHGFVRANGTFSEDYSSVSGAVHAHGNFGDVGTNCHSGRLTWTAAVDTGSGTGDGAMRRPTSRLRR